MAEPGNRPPFPGRVGAVAMMDDEAFTEKITRKTKQNPFVPIGCLATAAVLILGLRSFSQGNSKRSQLFMRGRVAAQTMTIVALVAGIFISTDKSK